MIITIKQNRFFAVFLSCLLLIFGFYNLTALAENRVFLDLKLEFLGEYNLTETTYQESVIGGFSGITYNPKKDVFYTISDDRSNLSPARFYTLKIDLNNNKINDINIENVTFLKNKEGKIYSENTSDTEGIAFSPRNTLFISSEGVFKQNIPPFINEYDLDGNFKSALRIPQRYITKEGEKKGIENNLGFESLTIKSNGTMAQDPFRLFTATESALVQDVDLNNPETVLRSRLMHYVINPFGDPVLIGEHLYIIDNPILGTLYNGISDLLSLPQEGYLLSLERTFGLRGYGVKIYQLVMANASDISNQKSLAGEINNITPIRKKLVLDLQKLGIKLDNLEGLTFGPRLADGSQSLIMVSDNNFAKDGKQKNQFLLFKLT
ncbi:MAG: esterase-like activity of phytase family protein [Cyanobacteria bacterium]|nr:esterase-like activity of phytase family protein [Cyanobacteria bacterium CG_2015-16_32_12]NCO77673.1 esterase-like activity of phytase family protein [Cyanobacteria bacterium CG_2015-22_32_23]NCQ05153.1 esterase-like activity of phytase family protein [Cyanobacteria bacterium CG_2015-09_32_10]NCQ41476.1 esterase-like activity of phytase family protein [Cyanobacteria bacterium CG_2015-04_32_10]NCS83660.1 esterase-like activity of phytase family protein [Cyanobacteria bacterium CG_2015-02_32_